MEKNIRHFFLENRSYLEDMYPGISINRLLCEFNDYCKLKGFERRVDALVLFTNLLREGVPLEYITGRAFFYNEEFQVDMRALIPRSETEILVSKTLEEIEKRSNDGNTELDIVDIGTGSGAIILSILMESSVRLKGVAIDISQDAIQVAKENLILHQDKITKGSSLIFRLNDRLSLMDEKFDLVVSNPPYIKVDSDCLKVHKQVMKYEPHQALFLEDESYEEWFNEFFSQVWRCLKKDGFFIMEGHEDHLEGLCDMLKNLRFAKTMILSDYCGAKRFLTAYKG